MRGENKNQLPLFTPRNNHEILEQGSLVENQRHCCPRAVLTLRA
jgi:hypothetical protein